MVRSLRPLRSVLLLFPIVWASARAGTQECYFHREGGQLRLGNSAVEITIDAQTGAIAGLRNKKLALEYLGHGTPEVFRIVDSTWLVNGAEPDNVWSAAYGTTIPSSNQKLSSTRFEETASGARFTAVYDRLRLERRSIEVAVTYTIELKPASEETLWRISIDNRDLSIIREVQFPFLSGLSRMDWLILPNHSGQRLTDPISKLSDEIPLVSLEYPARASMQWFEYYTRSAGLYVASCDKSLEYTRLNFGRYHGDSGEAAMWFSKFPFVAISKSWNSSEFSVGIHAGDWHWGADRYREWLASWVPEPQVSRHVRELAGGGDAESFIKDTDESLVHSYEDAARIANTAPPGAPHLFVGWMPNGHDTYYPEYRPIPELGGEEALIRAIDTIHKGGRLAAAYVNARIAAVASGTYREHGKQWAVETKAPGLGVNTITFGELHEGWNEKWEPAKRREGAHAVMCPSARGWQDHLVAEISRAVGRYKFDGIFIDQPGSFYAELCYARNHGHSTPANAWGPGYLEMLRRIRAATRDLNPDSFLWIEGMNDAYSQYLDYCLDKNPTWDPMKIHPEMETFAEMWRYTLPSITTVNGPATYSYPPSKDPVYGDSYHFVMGIRSGNLGRNLAKASELENRTHSEVSDRLLALWNKGGEFFFRGRFLDDVGLRASTPDTFTKLYKGANGLAVAAWNTTATAKDTKFEVDLRPAGFAAAKVARVYSLASDTQLPFTRNGDTVRVRMKQQAHETGVVVIRIQ